MANGWWNDNGNISGCVAAYQPIGAASLAASYVNLQNPGTYNAAPGTAPTFATATGWTFNGTTQYLTTGGVVPAAGWSAIVRFSALGSPGTNAPALGAGNNGAGSAFQIIPHAASNGDLRFYAYGTSFLGVAPKTASGIMALVGGANCYLNGSSDGATVGTFSGAGQALYVGCRNNGGTADRFCPVTIEAIAIYNAAISGAEVATLTTLMNALPVASAKGLPLLAHYHHAVFGGG